MGVSGHRYLKGNERLPLVVAAVAREDTVAAAAAVAVVDFVDFVALVVAAGVVRVIAVGAELKPLLLPFPFAI